MSQIFVIADLPNNKQVAIERACERAIDNKSSLHIAYFCYQNLRSFKDTADEIKQKIIEGVNQEAKQSLAEIVPEGIDYSYEVVWEKAIDQWVTQYALNHQPSMVVKTAHRSERFLYTPTDWQLLRACSAPIFLVSDNKWRKSPNVLAAVDLETKRKSKQALNHQILKAAKAFADTNSAELFVCYTVSFSKLLRDLGIHYKDEVEREAQKSLLKKVQKLAKEYDVPQANFIIKAGEPSMVIPSVAAKQKAGLVVIGTTGRKGLKAKILGNTAEKILSFIKSDVFALKP